MTISSSGCQSTESMTVISLLPAIAVAASLVQVCDLCLPWRINSPNTPIAFAPSEGPLAK